MKSQLTGFTLVELMISLTLGLLIVLAATQLFLTNQQSFNMQSGMSNVQENGRFALDYINSTIRSSEYSSDSPQTLDSGIITDIAELPGIAAVDKMISANDAITLGIDKSDQLVTRMWISQSMIDSGFRNCEGNAIATPSFVVSRYFVRNDGGNVALACDAGAYVTGDAVVANFQDNGVVLLSGIDSFQFLLGVSAVPVPALPANRVPVQYMTLTSYLALTDKPVISSIRLGLLVKSNEKVTTEEMPTKEIKVLEKTVSATSLNDKHIHRLFTSTLALRNTL